MKITLLSSWPPDRGISPYSVSLAEALWEACRKNGHEMEVLTFSRLYPKLFYPGGAPRVAGVAETPGDIPVRRDIDAVNPFTWNKTGRGTTGDILHVQHWSWPPAPALRGVIKGFLRANPGAIVVMTLHNIILHDTRSWNPTQLLYRMPLSLADAWIVHHDPAAEQLRHLSFARKRAANAVNVVPHTPIIPGVIDEVSASVRSPEKFKETRAGLGWPLDIPVGLLFGNIRPYKGVDTAIKAMAAVSCKPLPLLVVAGKPWMKLSPCRRLAKRLGVGNRVRWETDFLPEHDLLSRLACADFILLPHRAGFSSASGAALLAGFSGAPVLVSDLPGMSAELLPDCRRLSPDEPDDWARAIEELISARSRLRGADEEMPAGLNRAEKIAAFRDSAEKLRRKVAEQHLAIYEAVSGRGDLQQDG